MADVPGIKMISTAVGRRRQNQPGAAPVGGRRGTGSEMAGRGLGHTGGTSTTGVGARLAHRVDAAGVVTVAERVGLYCGQSKQLVPDGRLSLRMSRTVESVL